MSLKQVIHAIDAEIAAEHESIAEARDRIKELLDEREELALKLTNLERETARAEAVERGRNWKLEHPEEHAAFMTELANRSQEFVIEGFLDGWWELDENGDMAAPALVFTLSDFAEVKNPLLAHVMAKAAIFPSVGQARKNGWDKPLETGEWTVTKKKIRIRVE